MTKDYRLLMKVKNDRILSAMEEYGYASVSEFCHANGKPNAQSAVGQFVNLKKSPITKRGEWSETAVWLAHCLGREPEDLFTEIQASAPLQELPQWYEAKLSEQEAAQITDASDPSKMLELQDEAHFALTNLRPRERKVLELRFGLNGAKEHTLAEIGQKLQISPVRVQQLEAAGMRRVRYKFSRLERDTGLKLRGQS